MANANMQSAARYVRSAVNDLTGEQTKLKTDSNIEIQKLQHRLNEIKNDQQDYMRRAAGSEQPQDTAQNAATAQSLEREASDIKKQIEDIKRNVESTYNELQRKKDEYSRIASDLEMAG